MHNPDGSGTFTLPDGTKYESDGNGNLTKDGVPVRNDGQWGQNRPDETKPDDASAENGYVWVLDTIVYEADSNRGDIEYSVAYENATLHLVGNDNGQAIEYYAQVPKIISDARDSGLYREGSDNVYNIYTKDGDVGYGIVYRDGVSEKYNINKLIPEKQDGAFFAYLNEWWYVARYTCMPYNKAETYQTKHLDMDTRTYLAEQMYLLP